MRYKNLLIVLQFVFLLCSELAFSGVSTFTSTLTKMGRFGLKEGDQFSVSNNSYLGLNRMKGESGYFGEAEFATMASNFDIVRNAIPNEGSAVATISSGFARYANAKSKDGATVFRQATMMTSSSEKLSGSLYQSRVVEFDLPTIQGKVRDVKLQVLDLEKIDPVLVQTGIGNVTRTFENGSVVRETLSIAERSGQKPLRVTKEFELTTSPKSPSETKQNLLLKLDDIDPKTEQSRTISVEWKQDYNAHSRIDGFSRKTKLVLPDEVKGDIIGMVARPAAGGGFDLVVSTSDGKEHLFKTVIEGKKLTFAKTGLQNIPGGLASFAVKVKPLATRQETNTTTRGLKINGAGVSN